jgi:DNA repair protein RecO (recombination protein O)
MESSRAILIRLTRLTETSLIVHWYSEAEGLIQTVARGARRPGSPFAGKLDLFFSVEISYVRARRGELHTLREAAVLDWRDGLRKSYLATLLAGYFCQVVEAAVEPGHADSGLYDLLQRGLDHVARESPSLRALLHFERETARLLGISNDPRGPLAALRDAHIRLPASREQLLERLGREL